MMANDHDNPYAHLGDSGDAEPVPTLAEQGFTMTLAPVDYKSILVAGDQVMNSRGQPIGLVLATPGNQPPLDSGLFDRTVAAIEKERPGSPIAEALRDLRSRLFGTDSKERQ